MMCRLSRPPTTAPIPVTVDKYLTLLRKEQRSETVKKKKEHSERVAYTEITFSKLTVRILSGTFFFHY